MVMDILKQYLHPKKHVIWDWNGTLLADLEHAVRVVNQLLKEEGLQTTTLDQYKKIFGFPVIEYYKKLGFDTSPKKFAELCERFNSLFHDGLHVCELWPGVREILSHIKSSGRIQSVLSASEHNYLLQSVKQFGVEHFFDNVVGISNKMAGSKIDFGRKLMSRVAVPPGETILIGDTDHDLEVADALGIDIVLVEHGHQCPTRLRDVHHTVVKALQN